MSGAMTAQEMVGRTKQATKQAREALDDTSAAACTPEAHRAVVQALRAQLDVADAHSEYFGNGFSDSIATATAAKMQERKPLTINGREIALPSASTLWRGLILVSVLVTGSINGCRESRFSRMAPTAAVAATAPTAAVAATAPSVPLRMDVDTIRLLRELLVATTNGIPQ